MCAIDAVTGQAILPILPLLVIYVPVQGSCVPGRCALISCNVLQFEAAV